jgi:hypothetical protein
MSLAVAGSVLLVRTRDSPGVIVLSVDNLSDQKVVAVPPGCIAAFANRVFFLDG